MRAGGADPAIVINNSSKAPGQYADNTATILIRKQPPNPNEGDQPSIG